MFCQKTVEACSSTDSDGAAASVLCREQVTGLSSAARTSGELPLLECARGERAALRIRLRDLAGSRIRFGYRRLHLLQRREGWVVNHKLEYRLYVEESLILRRTGPKRRKSTVVRQERVATQVHNDSWSMDFMSDRLF
jgi:transposase InsO family protein